MQLVMNKGRCYCFYLVLVSGVNCYPVGAEGDLDRSIKQTFLVAFFFFVGRGRRITRCESVPDYTSPNNYGLSSYHIYLIPGGYNTHPYKQTRLDKYLRIK